MKNYISGIEREAFVLMDFRLFIMRLTFYRNRNIKGKVCETKRDNLRAFMGL